MAHQHRYLIRLQFVRTSPDGGEVTQLREVKGFDGLAFASKLFAELKQTLEIRGREGVKPSGGLEV